MIPLIKQAQNRIIELFFVDASHFIHGGFAGSVWAKVRPWISTPNGRSRHNVLAALNFISKKLEIVTNDAYITSAQVVELMENLARKYSGRIIVLVLDNARYQRCKLVIAKAAVLGIRLEFLPPYSPNLNLIERFWKLVKAEVLNAAYLSTFQEFCKNINKFVTHAHIANKRQLQTLITDKFQLFDENSSPSIRTFH